MKATFKILFVFIQIMVVLPGILEVEYPSPFNNLLAYLQYLAFSFALADIGIKAVGLSCFVGTSYYSTFWFAVTGPIVFLTTIVLGFYLWHKLKSQRLLKVEDRKNSRNGRNRGKSSGRSRESSRGTGARQSIASLSNRSARNPGPIRQGAFQNDVCEILFTLVLAICFVVMPISTTVIFNTLSCEKFDDGERRLRADYAIDCDTRKHKTYEYLALFLGIPLYPVGIPLLFMVLLYRRRSQLKDTKKIYIMHVPSKVRFEDKVQGINFQLLASVVKLADFHAHVTKALKQWESGFSENQVSSALDFLISA